MQRIMHLTTDTSMSWLYEDTDVYVVCIALATDIKSSFLSEKRN